MKKHFGYGRQVIEEDDIAAVVAALRSDFLTQGPMVGVLEESLCRYTGAKYAVAVANGTAALHLAVLALEIGSGDEIITSPNTFLASANCGLYAGASVQFADIDSETGNVTAQSFERSLSEKTKVLLPVHYAGQSCEMREIWQLAQTRKLAVIEDAAHAIGSCYAGEKVGCCRFSDMVTFSFHPVKNITTGEGGAILTNRRDLYDKLCMLRAHGVTRDATRLKRHDGSWYYEMQMLGLNARMTDLQAALGVSQLTKLEQFKARRRKIFEMYRKLLADVDAFKFLVERAESDACFHLCPLLVDFAKLKLDKKQLFERLNQEGIFPQVHYIPVHLQPYYQEHFGFQEGDYPVAEEFYCRELSLPLYPSLSDDDVHFVVEALKRCIDWV